MGQPKILAILLVCCSYSSSIAQIPTNGLIAYYPFNGNANDATGNGNNGTVNGAVLTTDRFGNSNSAYYFDGGGSKISGNVGSVLSTTENSIAFWATIEGAGAQNPRIIGVGPAGTPGQFYSVILDGTGNPRSLEYYSGQGTGLNLLSTTKVYNGTNWKHYVVTFKNKTAKFYINGVYDSEVTGNTGLQSFTNAILQIGYSEGGTDWFNGKLDEIRIYNRELSASEVGQMYQATGSNLSNGLIAFYPFTGNANDTSGNAYHGTVHGNAALTTDRFGNANRAYSFDGVDDWIETSYAQNNLTAFSVSCWVKTGLKYDPSTNAYAIIQNRGDLNSGAASLTLDYDACCGKGWDFGFDADALRICQLKVMDNDNKWMHLVGVWNSNGQSQANAGQFRMYINGVPASSTSKSFGTVNLPATPSGFLKIARHDAWNTYFTGKIDDLGMWKRALTDLEVQQLFGDYGGEYDCVNWDSPPSSSDFTNSVSPTAFDYLCDKNVIRKHQIKNEIDRKITREEVAKISFRALYGDSTHTTLADAFPVPFIDLQPSVSNYVREAKVLSYLEYGDGISAFNRSRTHFKPKDSIARRDILKAFLETFNITPNWTGYNPSSSSLLSPFTDVKKSDKAYGYIRKAQQLGIIASGENTFRPGEYCTREEAFIFLYRLMQRIDAGTTVKPNADTSTAFFYPTNITPQNFARTLGLSDGNFNSYTKTSFGIAGLMPLTFAHSYNSAYTEVPDSFYMIQPFSKGWTHNYNCYLEKVNDAEDSTINSRAIIVWGDGTMNSFKDSANIYKPETEGVYATLTETNTAGVNKFTYTTKNKMVYEFYRIIVGGLHPVWPLMVVKDRNGNAIRLSWSKVNNTVRLDTVFDAAGRYLLFNYSSADSSKMTSVTAKTGSIVRSISFDYYTAGGDLKQYTDPRGNATTYVYESYTDSTKNHLLKEIQLPKGNIVDNTYESRKLKSSEMSSQFKTTVDLGNNFSGGSNSNFTSAAITTLRSGKMLKSNVAQNAIGSVTNIKTATGNLGLAYNNSSHITKPSLIIDSITNLSGTPVYDANGNVLSVTKSGGGINITESFTYNSFNDILIYKNGRNNTTTFTYNAAGNLTQIKDALNNITTIVPNANGTVAKVTNPEGIYTDFTYDIYGNTKTTTLQSMITSSADYDDASRLIKTTDPNGVITQTEYEANDLVRKVTTDPSGLNNVISYKYDANDNLDTIINPKGGVTKLTYDNWDELVQYSFAGFNKTYAYNEDGSLKTFTSQKGDVFNYVYNDTTGNLQDDGYALYTYDAQFNLQTVKHKQNTGTITFGYDGLKRTNKIGYSDFVADTVRYEYDNNNNVTAIIYPHGFKVGYLYDELDRLKRVYNTATNADYATYTYYNDGRLKQQTNGNGTKTIYHYDAAGRLDSIANIKSNNSIIAAYGFGMDNVGNHTRETANEPFAPAMPAMVSGAIAYTHDDANRMNSRGSTTFGYDNNGNNTQATGKWNSTYTYDSKDNLLTSTAPAVTCEYDGLENRRRKNNTRYVLDIVGGSNVLMETDLSGNATAYYIHGLGLICRLDAAQANPAYYHYDYRGSTTAITDASQNITHKYLYGPFGEMLAKSETGFANAYRYVGKYGVQFEDSSLYFMRARYYNPMKGRFLGEDPVWGVNLYWYAGNNPLLFIDSYGRTKSAVQEFYEIYENLKDARDYWELANDISNNTVPDYQKVQKLVEEVLSTAVSLVLETVGTKICTSLSLKVGIAVAPATGGIGGVVAGGATYFICKDLISKGSDAIAQWLATQLTPVVYNKVVNIINQKKKREEEERRKNELREHSCVPIEITPIQPTYGAGSVAPLYPQNNN